MKQKRKAVIVGILPVVIANWRRSDYSNVSKIIETNYELDETFVLPDTGRFRFNPRDVADEELVLLSLYNLRDRFGWSIEEVVNQFASVGFSGCLVQVTSLPDPHEVRHWLRAFHGTTIRADYISMYDKGTFQQLIGELSNEKWDWEKVIRTIVASVHGFDLRTLHLNSPIGPQSLLIGRRIVYRCGLEALPKIGPATTIGELERMVREALGED